MRKDFSVHFSGKHYTNSKPGKKIYKKKQESKQEKETGNMLPNRTSSHSGNTCIVQCGSRALEIGLLLSEETNF